VESPRALLRQFGYKPKKRFGQHFLIDAGAAARIARLVCESPPAEDFSVFEIGPGTGSLTDALVRLRLRVTAIEIDSAMVGILRAQPELQAAQIVHADALTFDYASETSGKSWRVTGNLPYNIATPLVLRFIEMPSGPERIVVMVQRDVAQRFCAEPATAAYGSLTVAVQYAMHVEIALVLPPSAFYPRPKVESAVVVLRRRERNDVSVHDENWFLQVVRAAFAYRRKTLANTLWLALGIERPVTAAALRELDLDTEIRGEQLTLDDFARLAAQLRR